MLDFSKRNHVSRAEGTARAKAQRQGTQSDRAGRDGRGGRGRRAAGRGAGLYGEGGQGAAEAWEQVRTDRLCVLGARLEILGLNVGLAEGTVLKFSQNS